MSLEEEKRSDVLSFSIPSFCCLLCDKKVGRNVVLSSVQLMGALDLVLGTIMDKSCGGG